MDKNTLAKELLEISKSLITAGKPNFRSLEEANSVIARKFQCETRMSDGKITLFLNNTPSITIWFSVLEDGKSVEIVKSTLTAGFDSTLSHLTKPNMS